VVMDNLNSHKSKQLQPIEALSSTEKFLEAARSAASKNFSEV